MAAAKKKAEDVQGTIESMPGLPGEATQIASDGADSLAPVLDAKTLDELEAAEHAEAMDDLKIIKVPAGGSASGVATSDDTLGLGELPMGSLLSTFKVWPYGSLVHDEKIYAPGETIELRPDQAALLGPVLIPAE